MPGGSSIHYTILDFAAAWQGGEPVPGDDVSDAAFFPFEDLAVMDLWSEAYRVIAAARALLGI